MSMTAEQERKMEDETAGVKPHSKGYWVDRYVMEFALMARKLRKGQLAGGGARDDKYAAIIERQLAKVDAAIDLIQENPQIAKELGESGKGIETVLEMLERKAAEIETDDQYRDAAQKVRKLQPGSRLNQVVRKAKVGGLVPSNNAALWA